MNNIKYCFVTVTDYAFFPGTVATVNSILYFHPNATIYVVQNDKAPLSTPQAQLLRQSPQVTLVHSKSMDRDDRYINAWELKAYAAHDLCIGYDVIAGIDSDCLLCSPVEEQIVHAYKSGGWLGGKDGGGADYGDDYKVYGMQTPAKNLKYMSTSLYFCAVSAENRQVLARWAECCSKAVFNGQGAYPGHGDQGVLNAVLFTTNKSINVDLLPNELWSQHWVYWTTISDFQNELFINRSAGNERQRAFHCGGGEKYWRKEHRDLVLDDHPLQTYPYVWFLAMLWFGKCRDWAIDPYQYLPTLCHHLVEDLFSFLPQIMTVLPDSRLQWENITDDLLNRAIHGIRRALSLGGGSMTEMIGLVASHSEIRRYVEIGSYQGGSILTMALRFENRDIDFYSVESFMGNFNGTMDGHPLPSRRQFLLNLARFPSARVKLIAGDASHNVAQFADRSIDCLFIDGCHDTPAVLRDIDVWRSKVREGGIISGDDYNWESVAQAVKLRFPRYSVTPSGTVWWVQI
jgi:hypothetical protein